MNDNLGKKAEEKIREWLDRPGDGYCFDRLPDQMTGFFGSKNICDFILFKSPNFYYIESKATWEDRFDFNRITTYQWDHLLQRSYIPGVYSYVIVLFASYKRAFILDIQDILHARQKGMKSINIKKFDTWDIPYKEILTIENSRKKFLDYQKRGNVL